MVAKIEEIVTRIETRIQVQLFKKHILFTCKKNSATIINFQELKSFDQYAKCWS